MPAGLLLIDPEPLPERVRVRADVWLTIVTVLLAVRVIPL